MRTKFKFILVIIMTRRQITDAFMMVKINVNESKRYQSPLLLWFTFQQDEANNCE